MTKVITYSRVFPAYHPKAGQPTYFVEKLCKSIGFTVSDEGRVFNPRLSLNDFDPKHTTIRAGRRFKAGDWFTPRVWSGRPYQSKQIIIGPDIQIKKTWDFELTHFPGTDHHYMIKIDGKVFTEQFIWSSDDELKEVKKQIDKLAGNDGLTALDLWNWFTLTPKFKRTNHFSGQIICWSDQIEY